MAARKSAPVREQLMAEASKLTTIHTGMALELVGILRGMEKRNYAGNADALVDRFSFIALALKVSDADIGYLLSRAKSIENARKELREKLNGERDK